MKRGRAFTGHESLWDSRRAGSEGQIPAGQFMVKDPEVLDSICSGEGKAEPVPLWAVGGEQDRMWLWDYSVLCFGYWSVPEKLVLPIDPAVCLGIGSSKPQLPLSFTACTQIFHSFLLI